MTGAPIYLVSACASGEEFVAAFRRYADKNGLFVPISEPIAIGRRGRFAVTLKDGGVMIEGEAEIVSSARTASVLHGRVGMTLRFLQPDEASKTLLGELEKARLAMRPAPPSVSPRPAEIPAEPRPVPPPVQGRIDAVNALAECVAIGDTEALAAATATTAAVAPPKAGPRFVVPVVPPAVSAGATPRVVTPPRTSMTPPPMAIAKADDRGTNTPPPAITPRATPQLEQLRKGLERRSDPAQAVPAISGFSQTMTAVAPIADPGPTSDTMVAASPPEPPAAPPSTASPAARRHAVEMPAAIPRSITRPGPAQAPPPEPADTPHSRAVSDTLTAVPIASLTPPSAPTDIGGVLVEPLPPIEVVEATPARDDESARTQIHAGAPQPPREPPELTASPEILAPPPPQNIVPAGADRSSFREATQIGAPPVPRSATPASPLPATLRPAAPIVAPERPALPEVEIAEPTDLSVGPPEPTPEPPPPDAASPKPLEVPAARQRKTEIGVAVVPPGVVVLPATMTTSAARDADRRRDAGAADAASLLAADKVTGADHIVGDSAAGSTPATARPEPQLPPALEEATSDDDDWTLPPATAMPLAATPTPAAGQAPPEVPGPAAAPAPLPTGDWTIALDPQAADGWSEPFETLSAEHLTAASPPSPPPAVVAVAQPRDPVPKRPTPRPNELPIAEPKVQIDPTLIEPLRPIPSDRPLRPMPSDMPLRPMPPDDPFRNAAASSGAMPAYGASPGAMVAGEMPPMNMMTAVPEPGPFVMPHGQPGMHPGQVPAYTMDPSYQMVPMAAPFTAGGSGLGDPRYSSETAMPVQSGSRRVIIVIASALVAVVIGIVVLLALSAKHDAGAPAGTDGAGPPPETAVPPKAAQLPPAAIEPTHAGSATPSTTDPAPTAPAIATEPTHTAGSAPPKTAAGAPGDTTTAAVADPAAGATAPEPGTCSVDVSSVPTGAEIVIDQTNVIGTTPQKVTLPCGAQVELLIRKARLVPMTRTITPIPEGAKLKVTLAKQTFLVKVSSTPAGATITMNGKSLGVTPTTIKIPAFEASTLTVTKDGYATETEKVTPKSNGVAVHSALKKLGKKPR